MNLVVLIGNLARDPEVRYSQGANQMAIAKFTLGINRYVRNGENETDWIRVTAFGKQAELAENYLRKGNKVAIEGRIQTGSYDDKDGKKVYTTDVIANRIEFVEKKGQSSSQEPTFGGNFDRPENNPVRQQPAPQAEPEIPVEFTQTDDDDDVPF